MILKLEHDPELHKVLELEFLIQENWVGSEDLPCRQRSQGLQLRSEGQPDFEIHLSQSCTGAFRPVALTDRVAWRSPEEVLFSLRLPGLLEE